MRSSRLALVLTGFSVLVPYAVARGGAVDSSASARALPVVGPATGLADSAALRATVFGTPPQELAPGPKMVPLRRST